jgi:hypothetical protein
MEPSHLAVAHESVPEEDSCLFHSAKANGIANLKKESKESKEYEEFKEYKELRVGRNHRIARGHCRLRPSTRVVRRCL